jgi:hypothetical protein
MKERRMLRLSGLMQMGAIALLAHGAALAGWVTPMWKPSATFSLIGGAAMLVAWIMIESRLYDMGKRGRWPK